MTRLLPAAIAFALTSLPALALADVDVTFSGGVKTSLGGDPGATSQETELEDALNDALDGIADGSVRVRNGETAGGATQDGLRDLARRLAASGQTIRILCREEARELGKTDPVMARLYEQSEVTPLGGGAATHGDFDAVGNPRRGGTMIIVIECARLLNGWFRPPFEGGDTMLHTLGHELVHGGNRANAHGGSEADEPYYDAFGDLVQRVAIAMQRQNEREKRKREKSGKGRKAEKGPSGGQGGSKGDGRRSKEAPKQAPKEAPPCEDD